ncbi:six-bladed beta-propeller [Trichoderma arundinaceum]|uniref:Six-bladed beta-propeller n=1 Tax=Trichoderma arundinaceum TaxID=490622 RepID=A0A395NFW2_TRIAR|nr:six-bladed beta-propeller [Trichoderma arundinaceum]
MALSFIRATCKLLVLAASLAAVSAQIHESRHVDSHLLPSRVVVQFPAGTWIENIAVRSNGNLLLTSFMPDATLYEVSDLKSSSPTITRLFTIDRITSLFGITETSADVFAIAGGNFSQSTAGVKGTFGLWKVNFTDDQPYPELVTSIPDAILLNGATTVPEQRHLVLLADSILNVIWRVDVNKRSVDKAVQFPPQDTAPSQPVTIGINGIHINDGYLWFTNDTAMVDAETGRLETSMYRIRIDKNGGAANNTPSEKVLTLPSRVMDDFIYGPNDRSIKWIATNSENVIFAAAPDGRHTIVAGAPDSFEVATATACQFGRTREDSHILYVSTGGGTIKGTTEGGRVQALDTTAFRF